MDIQSEAPFLLPSQSPPTPGEPILSQDPGNT